MTGKSNLCIWVRVGLQACLITALASVSLVLAPSALAQSMFANLSGTVSDVSGAVLPGTKVIVQDVNSKASRQVTTNSSGYFSLTELPAGTYNVTAEAKGFEKWIANGVTLQGSDQKSLSVSLKVGTETETVEVNATAGDIALVDSGEKSSDLSQKEIQDLSLVGRNALELIKVLPGFSLSANGGLNKPAYSGQVVGINGFCSGNGCNAGGIGGNFINGQSLTVTQDGQNAIDPGGYGAATPVNANPEAISEVKVLSSNFSAENAQGPVVVNASTKGGGSSFHGGISFYARNSALNATDALYKDPGFTVPKPTESYYYPGARIGGPVFIPGTGFNKSHQKLFFFEMFEAYRQNLDGGVDRAFIPTPAMLKGDFSFLNTFSNPGRDPGQFNVPTTPASTWLGMAERPGCSITGGIMNSACIDPNQQALLADLLPTTGYVDPATHNGYNYEQSFSPAPQNSWQNVTREDINLTESTKVFVTWSRQRETAEMPTGLWVGAADTYVPPPSATIGANGSDALTASFLKIFSPTMTSETTFGYTWINFPSNPSNPNKVLRGDVAGYQLKGIFNNPDVPAILSWGGGIAYMGDVGHEYHPTMIAVKAIPSVKENLTKVFRTHTTKYGFFYQHLYNKQDNWGQFMGVYQYTPIWWGGTSPTGNQYADALMGMGASYFEQALPPPSNLSQNIYAFYAQDDWKFNRRITINYGMRFEHYAKPFSPDGYGLAVFDPLKYGDGTGTNPGVTWHRIDSSVPLSGTKSRLLYFSPRVGAAIDVFGTGRTVVRGGWGRYRAYDSVQSNNYTAPAQTALGSVGWGCGNNDTKCPTVEDIDTHAFTPVYGSPVLNGTTFSAVSPRDDEQPLVTSYSLSIDQRLPSRFNLELSYVGNHTDFMQVQPNINAIPLGAMATAMTQYPADCTTKDSNGNPVDNRTNSACENHYRPFTAYTQVNESLTAGKGQFDSFQASVRRSIGWLTLQANYTFEKAIGDNGNGDTWTGAFADYGQHFNYGILPYDRAHNFSAAYVFDLPQLRGGNKLLNGAANGWQVSGITTVESGQQISSNSTYNLGYSNSGGLSSIQYLGTPDVPVLPVYTCNPAKGLHSQQYMNPNCFAPPSASNPGSARTPYMPGPMYWNTDLTLAKTFKITERQNVQFRFQTFNPLNHSLVSFNSGDQNAKIAGFSSTGQVTNATGSTHPCPGPQCTNFGYADYALGHRVLELGVRYSF